MNESHAPDNRRRRIYIFLAIVPAVLIATAVTAETPSSYEDCLLKHAATATNAAAVAIAISACRSMFPEPPLTVLKLCIRNKTPEEKKQEENAKQGIHDWNLGDYRCGDHKSSG